MGGLRSEKKSGFMTKIKSSTWMYHLASIAIFIGAALTLLSALRLCTSACNQTHNYRLFHLPFEIVGGVYFLLLTIFHFLARGHLAYRIAAEVFIAGGLGAELFFICLQKFYIGSWCPICLSIAGTLAILGICYLLWKKNQQHEGLMRGWLHAGTLMVVLTLGFTTSFLGISKIDTLEAAEQEIKDRIKFGNTNSPIQVFVFTDWTCPACRSIEPRLEAMAPKVMKYAQITFIDTVVHPETLNFAPYNISFMVNAKSKYFMSRNALNKLSLVNKNPTDHDIADAVRPFGIKYQEIPYQDVSVALRYFEELTNRFKITGTPTVAVINADAKKGKKFSGTEEITEENILKAIETLR